MGSSKKAICILPMGDIEESVIGAISKALSWSFNMDVSIAPEVTLPVTAYNTDRHQYLSLIVIEDIALMDMDSLVLGISNEDFYAEGLQYVFGEADRARGVAVVSLARLRTGYYGGKPDEVLLVERAVKEAMHEVGHLMGMPHCRSKHCVMRYSNHIKHTDMKSSDLCPLCKRFFESQAGL